MGKNKDIPLQGARPMQDSNKGLMAEGLEAFQGVSQASQLLNIHGAVTVHQAKKARLKVWPGQHTPLEDAFPHPIHLEGLSIQ